MRARGTVRVRCALGQQQPPDLLLLLLAGSSSMSTMGVRPEVRPGTPPAFELRPELRTLPACPRCCSSRLPREPKTSTGTT